MFCEKCGKEVQEEWVICPQCGSSLKEETTPLLKSKEVKKKKNKVWLWVVLGMLVLLILGSLTTGTDDSETKISSLDEQHILDKLQTFTTVYKGEDRYDFLENGGKWTLTYTSENEFVSFKNNTVIECFTDALGEGCFSESSVSNLGFSYDLSDNEARIYFDVDIKDGHLTIVSYSLSDQEYEIMLDGEKWSTTDVFMDYVEEYRLAESIEQDVKEFKDLLQQYEITVDDLLKVKYDTLELQFIADMEEQDKDGENKTESEPEIKEESKTGEGQDTKEENTESATDTLLGWKEAYLDYLNKNANIDYEYSLDYIDDDDIPELIIDHMITAEGVYLCTYDGENVITTPVGEFLRYRLKENLFCVSGGRMDYYYDIVYEIDNGIPKEISRGEYGILDYENIKYDESGYIIYQYLWNGESVSEYDYYALVENFNYEEYPDVVRMTGRGYLYDIIDILEHPLDITIINPYLNDNGYESLLNHYIILFDGIEDDKLHFTVTYNDELVGSASATIIDTKTAEYKNVKSELVIKFDMDYRQLEIEGYMDTIDLTGSYIGRWG